MRSDLIYIPDSELDALIQQDTPYLDLTTLGLDIGDEPGSLSFYTREACVLCCTEEVWELTVQDLHRVYMQTLE